MASRSNLLIPPDFHSRAHNSCSQSSSLTTSTKSPQLTPVLPHSVKGAPAHLRTVIRKRQNSESAKRSRLRRKEAAVRFYQRFEAHCRRIQILEAKVAQLAAQLVSEEENTHDHQQIEEKEKIIPKKEDVCQPNQQDQLVIQGPFPDEMKAFQADLDALLDSCVDSRLEQHSEEDLDEPLW